MKKSVQLLISIMVLFSVLLAACAPAAATQAPAAPAAPAVPAAPEPTKAPAAVEPTKAPAAVEPTKAPAAAAGPKRGGTLTWVRGAAPEQLDMYLSEANQDYWILVNIVEPLVRVNFDGTDVEGAVADKWEISKDGLTYTFHIRDGIKFSDGTPVTPEDVVLSMQTAAKTGPWKSMLTAMKSVEKVDASNVKFTLNTPYSPFLSTLALLSNSIIPAKLYTEKGNDEFFKNIVGTGPFKMTEWVVNDHIVLEKNANYWDVAPDGKPYPYLDKITINQVPEDTTRVLQVQSGKVDGTDALAWSQADTLKKDAKADFKIWPSTQSHYIFMNTKIAPLDDVKFRQALEYATDRQSMVDAVLFGNGAEATTFLWKNAQCWDKDNPGFPFDLEKAKKLLAESKYPTGAKVVLEVSTGSQVGRDNAAMLKDQWSQLGITVDVQQKEGGLLSDEFRKSTHTAISGYQRTNDITDVDEMVQWFIVDPMFHSGWKSDKAVDLAQQAAIELDPAKRCDMYKQIQTIFNEDAPAILLYHTPFNTFVNKDVQGFSQISLGWLRFEKVWLNR
jgi:peptide/nickel transport system substrate-binding protein